VVCKNLGLRLPTKGEALLLLNKTGGETWADDIIVEGPGGAATRVQNGTVVFTPIAQNHAFRWVTVVG
jgi:predicted RNA-binding protein with PUA domain